MHRPAPLALALAALLAGSSGCSRPAPAPAPADSTHTSALGASHGPGSLRSQALIDSGNAAFRAKDFDAAARRYASAVAIQPDDPAAYYGLGMALSRLGRDDEARTAYAKARELAARSGDSSLVLPH